MARNENPPFNRGETFYNGGTITIDASTSLYGGYEHEGKCWEFEDLIYTQSGVVGAKNLRTNRMVKCMAVRNVSGITLLPGYLVSLKKSGVKYLGQVDGYAISTSQSGVAVVDEWLPAGGVPANDLFWVVVAGPTTIFSDQTQATSTTVFAEGLELVAMSGTGSTASTANLAGTSGVGRVQPLWAALSTSVTVGLTTNLSATLNTLGYALTSTTSGQTNTAILVNLRNLPWANPD